MRYRRPFTVGWVVALLLSTASCFSLRPWFAEEKRVFEEALLGRWISQERDAVYEVKDGQNGTYQVTRRDPGEDRGTGQFDASLARLDDVYYLDLSGRDLWDREDTEKDPWLAMTHILVRLEMGDDTLRLRMVDPDKLMRYVEKKQLEGVGVNVGFDATLLVSTTETLQTFLEKHGRKADLWLGAEEDLLLERK